MAMGSEPFRVTWWRVRGLQQALHSPAPFHGSGALPANRICAHATNTLPLLRIAARRYYAG